MATTESRTGFRLPWSSEERSDKAPVGRTDEAASPDEAPEAVTEATSTAPAATDEATSTNAEATVAEAVVEAEADATSAEATASTEIDQPTASDSSPKEASVESTAKAAPAPSRSQLAVEQAAVTGSDASCGPADLPQTLGVALLFGLGLGLMADSRR